MTINVSVRVPDGMVIASDSLASSFASMQPQVPIPAHKCENCGHDIAGTVVRLPPIGVPAGSTPLAAKLFYIDNYGITFFGQSSINGRSLFNHVLIFRTTVYRTGMQLHEIASTLAQQLQSAIQADGMMARMAPGTELGGFQICGYDSTDIDIGRVAVVVFKVGQDPVYELQKMEHGVFVTGVHDVVQRLFTQTGGRQTPGPAFERMTLPDAIDYAKYLVQTTSDFQRFAPMVPTVGGPIDVAVITKWIGFRWIQRKRILGDDSTRLNVGKITHEIGQIRRDLPEIIQSARQSGADAPEEIA